MTQRLREEIEAVLDQYLHDRPHHSAAESDVAMKAYRAGATAFAIRALEMAAEIARPYGRGGMYAILKLAAELRGSK